MLKLEKLETGSFVHTASYQVTHSQGSGREGTVLEQPLTMVITPNKTTCKLVIEECEGETPKAALDRLAHWCERMAKGLRERPEKPLNIPVQ